jgi:hypothetical protein
LYASGTTVNLAATATNEVINLSGVSSSGSFAYAGATALTVSTVNAINGVTSAGSVTLSSAVATTITKPVASGSNAAVSITAGNGLASGGLAINDTVTAGTGSLNLRDKMGNISQTAALTAGSALIISDQGSVTLSNPANSIGTLAGYANHSGGFNYFNAGALTISNVLGSYGAQNFAGVTNLTAATGDITVSDTTYGAPIQSH